LTVLAAVFVVVGCGGRASGPLGAGSGANEGGSSRNVTSAPEGSTGETQPEAWVADSPSEPAPDGSVGNPVTAVDAGADATTAGGSVDAMEGLEASPAPIDATDATEIGADIEVPCGPPGVGTYFVDPSAGHDDDGGNGSQACPFRSLTHALSLVGDAGASVTVEIVNTSAAPTLSQSTGEVFPITVPGGVTITAADTAKNTPTVDVGLAPITLVGGAGCGGLCARGFYLFQPNARLSHLVVNDQSPTDSDYGIVIESPGTVTIDHVTVQNFGMGFSEGIHVSLAPSLAPNANDTPAIGPGVVVRDGVVGVGLDIETGTVTITGGQGPEHTSFTGYQTGIWVRNQAAVDIRGTPISPNSPDVSDVDVDNNTGSGLLMSVVPADGPSPPVSTVSGLHAVGNGPSGLGGIETERPVILRGSYIADNMVYGVWVSATAGVDLGNPVGPDYGRNIFVGNVGGDICNGLGSPPLLATGNVFGTIDCSVGGKLSPAVLGNTADCGDATTINVSNCTF
jgi:hypothetical protein